MIINSLLGNAPCSVLTNNNKSKCDGEEACNCQGDYCLGGGSCSHGNLFIRGEAVGATNWDIKDGGVICRQMGFDTAATHITDRR